jgi:hypothetical protein
VCDGIHVYHGMDKWKLLNGEPRNLYSSPSLIRIIKSRTVIRAEHVARIAG